jgi:hypothetical protein
VKLLRTTLKQVYSADELPIFVYEGLLNREEISQLRAEGADAVLASLEQSGRISQVFQSNIIWRNWFFRLNYKIQPLVEQLTQRGNNYGA